MAREKRISKKNCPISTNDSGGGSKSKKQRKDEKRQKRLQQQQQQQQRSHRYRPGEKALREIRAYQRSTELIIKRAPFQRLVRDILFQFKRSYNMQAGALSALHVSLLLF